MQVIATAGHVDHGKSALLRALTGMEPDRWAEERRRGMTIDLGYVWMRLPSGERLAFVDVPGHARFVPNMLAGVGQVPAVLFVVAADGGWMPQSAEHLAAIDALDRVAASMPNPDLAAPVRIWVDRAFTITGAGTVLTGTLPAGAVSRGDELLLTPSLRPVKVRGLQSLGDNAARVAGVARIALNVRGVEAHQAGRGTALLRPGEWTMTSVIDVRLLGRADDGLADDGLAEARLPRMLTLHFGSARAQTRVRMLGADLARLTLAEPLPLHTGERLLLRDPGAAADSPGITGAVVLDVVPPPVSRRGAAAAAVAELRSWPDQPSAADLLRRHKLIRSADARAMGLARLPAEVVPGWLADADRVTELKSALAGLVAAHATAHPLAAGMPVDAARAALGLPDREIIRALIVPSLKLAAGLITTAQPDEPSRAGTLPASLAGQVASVLADLAARPFSAPEAARLRELGLDNRALATAARHGALLRIADQLVLAPGADAAAGRVLAGLPQPFTAAQARAALGTTRRTLIPLLEHMDRQQITRRLPDDRRVVLSNHGAG